MDWQQKLEYMMRVARGDFDEAFERGDYPKFPHHLMVFNPAEKKDGTRSFYDLYVLSSRFDDLLTVSKVEVNKILEPRVKRKLEELIEDIKKIKFISKSKAKDAAAAFFNLPSAALGNIVDQMTGFVPNYYRGEFENPWKLEDRNGYKLRGELDKVYAALAGIHGKLVELCHCIQVNCQICLAEKFDWENDWADFVEKYEMVEVEDEENNVKIPEVD